MGIPGGKTESRPCNNVTIKKRCQETETMLKVAVKEISGLKNMRYHLQMTVVLK